MNAGDFPVEEPQNTVTARVSGPVFCVSTVMTLNGEEMLVAFDSRAFKFSGERVPRPRWNHELRRLIYAVSHRHWTRRASGLLKWPLRLRRLRWATAETDPELVGVCDGRARVCAWW